MDLPTAAVLIPPFSKVPTLFKTERRWAKGYLHEGGIRVPMIASWPGHIEPNSKSDHLSAFYDVLPTMREIIGLPIPDQTDGISLLPTLLNNSQKKTRISLLGISSI
jgi:arylsulfatase